MRYKILILALFLSYGALSGHSAVKTEYYYSLRFIKYSEPPRPVSMIMMEKSSSRVSVVKRGIIFTYKNRLATKVSIAGDFSSWRAETMERSVNGIWYYFLAEPESNAAIKYKFMCDGIWIPDPLNNDRLDDQAGSYVSLAEPFMSPEGKQATYKRIEGDLIEFRTYRPDAKFVSITGDFNNWNPEMNLLTKGKNGIWRIRLKVSKGNHRYNFIVDGIWEADIFNENSGVNTAGDLCSRIKIE